MKKDGRVWIMGAGLQGCSIALELAHRGHDVVLLDQDPCAMNRASLRNEGKIHLGLIYAADPSGQTAQLQLRAALSFFPLLARWLGETTLGQLPQSTPFVYAVAQDSLMPAEALGAHYEQLQRLYDRWADQHPQANYLGLRPERLAWPAQPDEHPHLLRQPGETLFSTAERALDTDALALAMRQAVAAHERIDWRPGWRVRKVAREDQGVAIHGDVLDESSQAPSPFSVWTRQVVNATWEQRIGLDVGVGLHPPAGWLHRLKYRVIVRLPADWSDRSSVTMVLGRYGDLVVRPNGTAFVSWYPSGLQGWSNDLVPPASWDAPCRGATPAKEARAMAQAILEAAERWYPGIAKAPVLCVDAGAIFAFGRHDVDHRMSGLHHRSLSGLHGDATYLSVDSGKLTTAPWFAMQAADRLLGNTSAQTHAWHEPWTLGP